MSYVLLIVEPEGQREARTAEQGQAVYQRMVDYAADLKRRGVLLAVESLRRDAARVSARGQPGIVDGPFTEAREFIGGFFLLDCRTREEALEYARQCPAAQWAQIEVRETGPCFS
ncbi:MAG: dehydrogenase [Proteobacteria bacterium]|nr:dehydrogenase [Pseudomonadota bacterium]